MSNPSDNSRGILIGLITASLIAGVSFFLIDDTRALIVGALMILFCLVFIAILFFRELRKREETQWQFREEIELLRKELEQQTETALQRFSELSQSQFSEFTRSTETVMESYNLKNDAVFIKEGFIGLQRQVNQIELAGSIEKGHDRLAILGHLPSYMRRNDLDMKMGNILYSNWQPPHLIQEYVRLVNQRKEAFENFIDHGGKVQDIFSKSAIEKYVIDGCTFHDNIEDPVEEIEERLSALLYYISKPNYYICMLKDPRKTPNYILKQEVGLVIDTRTAEITSHFTDSIDGIYTDSPQILKEFEKKFRSSWQHDQSNKDEIKKFLHELQAKVSDYKKERERHKNN